MRFTTSHPRDFTRDIVEAIDAVPTLCDHVHLPVQSGSSRILKAMNREYTRESYLERISLDQGRAPAHLDFDRHHRRLSRRNRRTTCIQTMDLLAEVEYDCVFGFKYSGRPNTPALTMIDSIPEAEKVTRLQVVLDRQREIQRVNYARHLGQINGSNG